MSSQSTLFGEAVTLHPSVVMTAHYGHNDGLIRNAARLYIDDRALVVDCTFGRGQFWKRTDTTRFRLTGLDLLDVDGIAARADFRSLPLRDETADVVVLDPPYVHSTTQPRDIHPNYRNNETTHGKTMGEIVDLYRAGMSEALRVLRPGGLCWVKCQDTVEGKQQKWNVVTVYLLGLELGYTVQDMFVLVVPSPPGARHVERQFHARRNHSYLWIFAKPRRARQRWVLPAWTGPESPQTPIRIDDEGR